MKRVTAMRLAAAVVAAGGLALSAAHAGADRRAYQPSVISPNSMYLGRSYSDWSASWAQHMLSIPCNRNPLLDKTGACALVDQSGPVFFIGRLWGVPGISSQFITIQAGTALFFPIVNSVVDNGGFDEPGPEPANLTIPKLRAKAATALPRPETLYVYVDNIKVPDPAQFRVLSPAFTYDLPATDNLWERLSGNGYTHYHFHNPMQAVADGYYIMLEPLPLGQHVLHFGAQGHSGSTVYVQVSVPE